VIASPSARNVLDNAKRTTVNDRLLFSSYQVQAKSAIVPDTVINQPRPIASLATEPMHILLRKLNSHHEISAEEQDAVLSSLGPAISISRGKDIVSDGSTPQHTTVMLSGTACRYKILPRGIRHILAFQYPGDMTDLYSYVMKKLDHAVGALSDCTIAQIPHEQIAALGEQYPNLQYSFWRDTMLDASISNNWILGGGRTTAERMANMLCEIFVRFNSVGLTSLGKPIPFNATQQDLADALGLSLVHTNKTLGALRKEGLIQSQPGTFQILDWEGLCTAGNFQLQYLHLRSDIRADLADRES
jgi:CRP-like cAMP-binding protein